MNIYDPIAEAIGILPTIDIKNYPTIEKLLEEHPPSNISNKERDQAIKQWADPEIRSHMIEQMKAKYKNPEHYNKMYQRIHANSEIKDIRSKTMSETMSNPQTHQKIRKTQSDPEWQKWFKEEVMNSPTTKTKCSEKAKARWADESFRDLRSLQVTEQLNNAPTFYCEQCDRTIKNHGNWALHLKSKKHAQFTCK